MAQAVADDILRRYHAGRAMLAGVRSWSVPTSLKFSAFDAGNKTGSGCGTPLPVIQTAAIRAVHQVVWDLLEAGREIGCAAGPASYYAPGAEAV